MRFNIDNKIVELMKQIEQEDISSFDKMKLEDELEEIKTQRRFYVSLVNGGVGEHFIEADIANINTEENINLVGNTRLVLYSFAFDGSKFIIKDKEDLDVRDFLLSVCVNGLERVEKGLGLIITGNIGSAKTYCAIAILKYLLSKYKILKFLDNESSDSDQISFTKQIPTFKFIQAQDIIALITSKNYNAEKDIENIRNVDILIIDDLGAEKHAEAWGTIEQLANRIIKYRDHKDLLTIITSNTNPEKFTEIYGQRAASVLFSKKYTHISLITKKSWRELK